MRAPYPSFTLVLTTSRSDGNDTAEVHLDENVYTIIQDRGDSLLKTILYTYNENNRSFQYPFQIVEQPPASVREACVDDTDRHASKITKFLGSVIGTWNRQWKRPRRGSSTSSE